MRLHHLVVLHASQINGGSFCAKMQIREASSLGETGERLHRLIVWRNVEDFDARKRAALDWTGALTRLDARTDYAPLRTRLREHFTEAENRGIDHRHRDDQPLDRACRRLAHDRLHPALPGPAADRRPCALRLRRHLTTRAVPIDTINLPSRPLSCRHR